MLLASFLTQPPASFNMPLVACVLSLFSHVQLFATPWTNRNPRFLCPWDSPAKNAEVGCHAFLMLPINILQSDLKYSLFKSVRIFCGMTCFSSLPPSSPPYHPFSPPSLWWHRLAGWHTPTPCLRSRSLLCFQGQSTKEYLSLKGTGRDGATSSLLLTAVKDPSGGRIVGPWKSSRQKECRLLSSPPPFP